MRRGLLAFAGHTLFGAALAQSPADLPFEEKRVRAGLLTIGANSGTAMACKFTPQLPIMTLPSIFFEPNQRLL